MFNFFAKYNSGLDLLLLKILLALLCVFIAFSV